ncbi:hypothetical protein [Jannaschia marina]|uniref:hypothetical protein n=1 Tax=Jannaschia marina TaxID=2741674 RepID=UPI0015CDBB23|nr:hypothetical protein [Jannaschia marina]
MAAVSKGVEALLERLRADGVAAGEAEAARLTAEAKTEAARVLRDATADAEALKTSARRETDAYRKAGEEALEIAMRDAVLTMKSGLMRQFEADVRAMVTQASADPDTIRDMVLEVAGRARPAGDDGAAVILPAEVVGPDAIRADPGSVRGSRLTGFVLGLTAEMLREGIELHAAEDLEAGIRVRVDGEDLEIDLSDAAIASLLMQHLQPRFRAVMEGVLR